VLHLEEDKVIVLAGLEVPLDVEPVDGAAEHLLAVQQLLLHSVVQRHVCGGLVKVILLLAPVASGRRLFSSSCGGRVLQLRNQDRQKARRPVGRLHGSGST
jgi:hypothetical protein